MSNETNNNEFEKVSNEARAIEASGKEPEEFANQLEQQNAHREDVVTVQPPEPLRVFISYRVKPDGPIASALKRLIESSILPQPEVFVSGDGGIRPSNVGFKQQIQEAAQRAHAFVAIITNASKEREWIIFEAGAAWGRGKTYVPVLVGARPEELSSTIGDYQALNSESKEDMLQLVTTLGESMRAEVCDRFGTRYRPFAKLVSEHLNGQISTGQKETDNELHKAFRLGMNGEIEESNEIFDRLESESTDLEQKCLLRVFRLQAQSKSEEYPGLLEDMDEELKNTSTYYYYVAKEVRQPLLRSEFLKKSIEIGVGIRSSYAKLEHAVLDFDLGAADRGKTVLMDLIRQLPRNYIAGIAVQNLIELVRDLEPFEVLLLYLSVLAGIGTNIYSRIVKLASKNEWTAINLHCSTAVYAIDADGTNANNLGIARAAAELPSLAYESYARASDLGISVARCNMAALIWSGSPSAALVSLTEHVGPFDAADRGYPYSLRAELERAIEKERDTERVFFEMAQRQFKALWAFAEQAIRTSKDEAHSLTGKMECGNITISFDNFSVHATRTPAKDVYGADIPITVLSMQLLGPNVFVIRCEKDVVFLSRKKDRVDAVFFEHFSDAQQTVWCSIIIESNNSMKQIANHS